MRLMMPHHLSKVALFCRVYAKPSKPYSRLAMASLPCAKCTFINPPSQKATCLICLSSLHSPSSPSSSVPTAPKWSCKSCTFLNPYDHSNCQICGTRSSPFSLLSTIDDDDDDLDPSIGSVFLPLRPCKRKTRDSPDEIADPSVDPTAGFRGTKALASAVSKDSKLSSTGSKLSITDSKSSSTDSKQSSTESKPLKIMTYNLWFREDLELQNRMNAIGSLIHQHSPDVICFQEVTPNIYEILQRSNWWKAYSCSLSTEMARAKGYFCMQLSKLTVKSYREKPFSYSMMGRELCIANLEIQPDLPLVIATSHLESPCPGPPTWDQMYSKERVQQAKEAMDILNENPNVIFCGDMNWGDKQDGRFPFPNHGWFDAWEMLRPRENGFTYDTKSNKMLTGNRTLQRRLDRFVCSLKDFKVSGIEMIGLEAIPELTYVKEKRVKGVMQEFELPVLPSDHYGLVLTINIK